MRENLAKSKLRRGEPVLGTWMVETRSTAVPLLLAEAGLDFVMVDLEHGPYTLETAAEIFRVARLAGITPLARVPASGPEWVGRLLDAGAQGLMLPRARTAEDARELIDDLRYPPGGRRGMAAGLGNTDFRGVDTAAYMEKIEGEILAIVQVETREVLDDLDRLAAVPGLDALFFGPDDLSIALGVAGQGGHEKVQGAVDRVLAAASGEHGLHVGIHTSNAEALPGFVERGLRLFTYASDVEFLQGGARSGVEALRVRSNG